MVFSGVILPVYFFISYCFNSTPVPNILFITYIYIYMEILEPQLAPNDKNLYCHYLDNAKVYFKFGSGGSTH